MQVTKVSHDENARLEKLRSYHILDSENEPSFDNLTSLACQVFDAQTAMIVLIDHDRQWFKSKVGIDLKETPRSMSICACRVLNKKTTAIEDVSKDPSVCKNPFFKNNPNLKFYLGTPLVTKDGYHLGTLCVYDSKSKKIKESDKVIIEGMASQVMELIESRKKTIRSQRTESLYRSIQEMSLAGTWVLDVKSDVVEWSDVVYQIYGIEGYGNVDKLNALSYFSKEDREKLSLLLQKAVELGERFDSIFEFCDSHKNLKWVRSIGWPEFDHSGQVVKVIGTFQDVSIHKEREDRINSIIESINEGIFEWDFYSEMISISGKFWKILGQKNEKKWLLVSEWKKMIHGSDQKRLESELYRYIESKSEALFCLQVRYRSRRGDWVWFEKTGMIKEWSEDGTPLKMVGACRNVTAEVEMNKIIHSYTQGLEKHALISKTDLKGVITYSNETFAKVSGYRQDELLGSDHAILNSHYHNKSFFKGMWTTIQKGRVWRAEVRNRAKDGTFYWVDTTITPLMNSLGEVEEYISIRYDITKRKEFEEEIKNSNVRLEVALDSAGLGVWDWDLENGSICYNKQWLDLTGLKNEDLELTLNDFKRIIHEDDYAKFLEKIDDYLNGKQEKFYNIHRISHQSDGRKIVLSQGRFTKWNERGRPTQFTGTDFDISLLKSTQDKLSMFFDNASCGLLYSNSEGALVEANKKFFDITGYEENELKLLNYDKIFEEIEKPVKELSTLSESNEIFDEALCKRRDGSEFFVKLSTFKVEDSSGREGFWSLVEDITVNKELEKQKTIAFRNSKLASIGELAAGIGHEINNPLAIILGQINLAQDLVINNDFDDQVLLDRLFKAKKSINRIENIVNGLRSFSRTDTYSLEQICLNEITDDTIMMLQDMFKAEGVSLKSKMDPDLKIKGQPGRIQQVLVNLLNNAKDSVLESGGGDINIEGFISDSNVRFIISDEGTGIEKSQIDKIFDAFYTTKEVNKGTGLGLSIVDSIVKEHSGQISVESEIGVGTKFILEFPVSNEQQAAQFESNNLIMKNDKLSFCARVLLVDDEEDFRDYVRDVLEDFGIDVVEACNGKEGFDLFKKEHFDLIISDMKMPLIDGPQFLEKVKKHPNGRDVPFAFITGGINFDISKYEELIQGVLPKPIDEEVISDFLSTHLAKKKVRDGEY